MCVYVHIYMYTHMLAAREAAKLPGAAAVAPSKEERPTPYDCVLQVDSSWLPKPPTTQIVGPDRAPVS